MESKKKNNNLFKRVLLAIVTIVLLLTVCVIPVFGAITPTYTGQMNFGSIYGRWRLNQDHKIVSNTQSYSFYIVPVIYPYENTKTANKPYDRYTYFPPPEATFNVSDNSYTFSPNPYKLKGQAFYTDGNVRQFDQIFIGVETAGSGGLTTVSRSYAALYYQGKQVDVLFNVSSYVNNKIINQNIEYLSFGTGENRSKWWNSDTPRQNYASEYLQTTYAFFSKTVTEPTPGRYYVDANNNIGALRPVVEPTGEPQNPGQTETGFTAFSNYIFTTLQGILNIEFLGFFTLGDLFGTMLAITAVLIFLKFYAGG